MDYANTNLVMHVGGNHSTNVQYTFDARYKPGKENSTVMLCKEALKRRAHKIGSP